MGRLYLTLFGAVLEQVGKDLQNPKSELSKKFLCNNEQFESLMRIIRILTAPTIQTMYIEDLANHWHKSVSTIKSWIAEGRIPKGHKRVGDTRRFWYASEVIEVEPKLMKSGRLEGSKDKNVIRAFKRAMRFLNFEEC